MARSESGPGGAVIHEVVGLDSPLLPRAIELFQTIFPDDAHYVPYVRVCAMQECIDHPCTLDHVWVVEIGGELAGLRVFSYVHTRSFGHGAFVGLLEPFRSRGIGSWLVRQTRKRSRNSSGPALTA